MIIKPLIPIYVMAVICVVLLVLKRKGTWPYVRQIIMVVLLFAINLRIQVPDGSSVTTVHKASAYVVFAIDDTISMLAQDYNGNHTRLEGVSKDCAEIIDSLYGAKFSVIKFSNKAELATPSTSDGSFIENVIDSTYPPSTYIAKGTNINVSKEAILSHVEKLKKKGDGNVYLIFISDGEMNNSNKLESFKDIKKYIDGGAVMGYGTSTGGKMFYEEYGYEGEYIQDTSKYPYVDAVSKIDENNLKQIASDLGVEYFNMNNKSGSDVYDYINNNITYSDEETTVEGRSDIYFIFVIPLVLMLAVEYVLYKRKA